MPFGANVPDARAETQREADGDQDQAGAQTEPGVQGDRVSGARKPATLETGKVIQVPLFVEVGDRVKVDTRSAEYITRV